MQDDSQALLRAIAARLSYGDVAEQLDQAARQARHAHERLDDVANRLDDACDRDGALQARLDIQYEWLESLAERVNAQALAIRDLANALEAR